MAQRTLKMRQKDDARTAISAYEGKHVRYDSTIVGLQAIDSKATLARAAGGAMAGWIGDSDKSRCKRSMLFEVMVGKSVLVLIVRE